MLKGIRQNTLTAAYCSPECPMLIWGVSNPATSTHLEHTGGLEWSRKMRVAGQWYPGPAVAEVQPKALTKHFSFACTLPALHPAPSTLQNPLLMWLRVTFRSLSISFHLSQPWNWDRDVWLAFLFSLPKTLWSVSEGLEGPFCQYCCVSG